MYVLKIECIGDDTDQLFKMYRNLTNDLMPGLGDITFGKTTKRYWVAEIMGSSPKYKYERKFVRCKKDYSEANSVGSRGVYAYYILDEGRIYEVSSPESWGKTDRYFCTVRNTELFKMSEEEVESWLKDRSG